MLWAAFTFGILSSLHCIGMCGPIALMLPVDRMSYGRRIFQTLSYHFGRIGAYSLIGLVFGTIGKLVSLGGMQQRFSVVCGVLMIAMALVPEKKWSGKFSGPVFRWVSSVKQALGSQFKSKKPGVFLTIGFLNGLLPCGLVYAAVFGSLSTQSSHIGALFMAIFGLGTVPLMSALWAVQPLLTASFRSKLNAVLPFFVALIGLAFMLRGFGLGIPYVSPSALDLTVGRGSVCH